MNPRWQPGDAVVLRELWDGKVWSVRPLTVVKDDPDEVMLYFWPDLHMKAPVSTHTGEFLRLPTEPWKLRDQHWRGARTLSFAWPGIAHAVLGFWDDATDRFTGWYVNMETPLRRRSFGFDSTEDFLDIVISPDLEAWSWKDEDELEEAVRRGLVTEERGQELRAEGERALERLRRRDRPFDRDWSDWRPDPTWSRPTIPDDPEVLR
jgi:predicted RNA-binding protein associated with RNAse of E/G family